MNQFLVALSQQKEALRKEMRAKRSMFEKENANSDIALTKLFLSKMEFTKPSVIAGYNAFRYEVDVNPLMNELREQGHIIVLPIVGEKNTLLSFHQHTKGLPLVRNKMGILEPSMNAPALDPDVLLVPLLAFDRRHNRLGYGAGFYDRTLTALRSKKSITAIGIAYAYQEVENVPMGDLDAQLDKIVTSVNVF